MTVFVDYDSMLNDMSYSWVAWINKTYNREYTSEDVTHWEWYGDLDVDAFAWFKEQIAFTEIQPLPLSQDFYKHVKENFDSAILTSSHENMVEAKDAHIIEYYGECAVIHHHNKWEFVTEDKLCVLVDDRPWNCTKWVEAGGIAILFNHDDKYRYADTDYEHERLHKVTDYHTIKEILNEIKANK